MNCTKCGKELTEEGKTICDECQKKLLEDIKNEPEKEEIVKEKKTKKDKTKNKTEEKTKEKTEKNKDTKKDKKAEAKKENKTPKKKEVKEENESEDKFKVSKKENKKSLLKLFMVLFIFIAIIAIAAIILYKLDLIYIEKTGNSMGNIRNYGYGAAQGDKVYYIAPNEDSSRIGIYSAKSDGTEIKELYMTRYDIMSLNAYGNYLYFIEITETEQNSYVYDNKMYRMKKDGSEIQVINDNEFNDMGYEIYIIKNKIYYIGEDSNIYKMNLDGSNRELVSNKGTGFIGISDKYILYNDYIDGVTEETENPFKTCIMNLDGTNARDIIPNTRLYTVNIYNDTIYYTNDKLELYSINVDGTNNKKLLDGLVYNLNVNDGYIYYLSREDRTSSDAAICIYRANLDGTDDKIIKKLTTGTNFINVLNGKILFMDTDLEGAYVKLTNSDGTEDKNLYMLSLKELYNQIEGTEIEEEIINGETANEVIESTPTTNEVVPNNNIVENTAVKQ